MPLPKALARFNRYVTNPIARLVAGWLPPFAVVLHRGRRSGREHRTPVWAFRTDDGLVVALTYGADSDWVRNVMKAAECSVLRTGRLIRMVNPRVVTEPEAVKLVPLIVRGPLRLVTVAAFLRLSVDPAS
ncbi:MAG TPA: nitroreductase family deazaflavin-dependent oxidoreductase [Actinomycetota bacterium]